MPRATLATAQSKRQVTDLIARIVLGAPGGTYDVSWGNISVSVKTKAGEKILSGVTAGGKWSVQVSTDIAEQFNIPLWKDS